MNKEKVLYWLDFIPLLILSINALVLGILFLKEETGLNWKHLLGFALLLVNYSVFYWRHKIGVLALGITIVIGLLGLISLSAETTVTTLTLGSSENAIPIFYGQPIFLLWFLLHGVISIRHYIGIGTKKYWDDIRLIIKNETPLDI